MLERSTLSLFRGVEGQRSARGSRLAEVLSKAYAPDTVRKDKGHWKWWCNVCARLGADPVRSDMRANAGLDPETEREEIELVMNALVIGCLEGRARANKDPAVNPASIVSKLYGVKRYARVNHLIEMVSLTKVVLASKGLLREYVAQHGVASLVPERKQPLDKDMLDGMFACPNGASRGTLTVEWGSYYWQALRACFQMQSESGERKAEVAKASLDTPFEKGRLTFDSLRFKINGKVWVNPSAAQLESMAEGDGVLLAHGVLKNDPTGAFFGATPTFLAWRPVSAGRSACREIVKMYVMAAVLPEAKSTTPLFGPRPGEEFTHFQVQKAFELLLLCGAKVPPAELSNYSIHSFRIYAACSLLEAGCPRWLIKRLLRWRGDESLEIYARVNDEEWAKWTGLALDARVDSTVVPRLPQIDVDAEHAAAYATVVDRISRLGLRPGSADF